MALYVSGPRSGPTTPVLTTAAKGVAGLRAFAPYAPPYGQLLTKYQTAAAKTPYNLTGVTALALVIDGTPLAVDLVANPCANIADKTKADALGIATCLNNIAAFKAVATAKVSSTSFTGTSSTYVTISGAKRGGSVQIVSNAATDLASVLAIPVGTYAPIETRTALSNPLNIQIDALDEDPAVTRTAGANGFVTYALGDVATLLPGTYVAYVEITPWNASGGTQGATARVTFQVGTATEDKHVAGNCKSCHEQVAFHGIGRPFDTDVCKSCHDDQHQLNLLPVGSIPSPSQWTYGAAANGAPQGLSQQGWGVAPFKRRAHSVHRGAFLAHPDQVNGTAGTWPPGSRPRSRRSSSRRTSATARPATPSPTRGRTGRAASRAWAATTPTTPRPPTSSAPRSTKRSMRPASPYIRSVTKKPPPPG